MTTVIKIGSNIVTDSEGNVREERLLDICQQSAELKSRGQEAVLVTSGAIALGMREMGLSARPQAMDELQAASAVGQGRLFQVYDQLLAQFGLRGAQVLLTFFDMSARTHYLNARQTLRRLLDWHRVPVVNENDTTATEEISFGDNDFLAAQVAVLVDADLLILLTDTEGLYSADPQRDADAKLIEEVRDFEELERYEIGISVTDIGVGGMRSKIIAAEMATAAGIPVVVCNGMRQGALASVIGGESVGTRFHPGAERYTSFKLWLKYAKQSRGEVVIDGGAARALTEQGKSLLPVGIVDVKGNFHAGDAVEISSEGDDAGQIAKGICNFSSHELERIKGMGSNEVAKILPRAGEEAVHRDYMVLKSK